MTSSTVLKEELNDDEVILMLALVFVRVPEISDTFALEGTEAAAVMYHP